MDSSNVALKALLAHIASGVAEEYVHKQEETATGPDAPVVVEKDGGK